MHYNLFSTIVENNNENNRSFSRGRKTKYYLQYYAHQKRAKSHMTLTSKYDLEILE